ncbi:propionate catabolism operon regulatory protein PrpR [Aromatoleum anaerobium]|uniref:propionate catabolism operon regulatory protein PrpR n=1 Tax=Aromatoleum anaerobium TaxID=182180 RepID=UPI001B7D0430|nr:propionate catabolism operon regulatory protein PrpR [Aromatoleum anaerobium]MCK0507535.1 propionate catabolism operon regulatory protein PrpR [Aromatoleum anaerobium]
MNREADRKPVIWAVSISRLKQLFHAIIPTYAPVANIQLIERGFDEAVQELRQRMKTEDVDVVVAAGSNGAYLRQHLSVPVMLVRVTGFDMLGALIRARKISDRIAIVTHETITPELEQFKHLFNLPIEQRSYLTIEDAEELVQDLVNEGIEVIAGPGMVTELAEKAGIRGVFLYSQGSVREALDEAIGLVQAGHIEEARRARLNTILLHLNEGVVAVDMAERIQSINPAMERLLGIDTGMAVGRPLSEIAPELSLRRTLQKGIAELEGIEIIGTHTVVANRIPVTEQGIQTGAVLTVQDSAAIERVDRNLRMHYRPRHFIAKYKLSHLLGNSLSISRARALAEKYARTDATVLITGESGTGKEILAQGIHNASRRRGRPFVALNCAAFPETLLEVELFGYEEGAFTGSRKGGKTGLFELAHLGTILLDEIGELSVTLQTRLLRVLQEKEVLRLGSIDPTPIDVRVIASTNRNLRDCVKQGDFREDLFYRLNILQIELPPLRERQDDLITIAACLLDNAWRRLGLQGSPQHVLEPLLPLLRSHDWPGNVREMESVIERVAVFCGDLGQNESPDPLEMRLIVPELFVEDAAAGEAPAGPQGLRSTSRNAELTHILKTIEECGGNQVEACRRLGIGRTTLWRKLKMLGGDAETGKQQR